MSSYYWWTFKRPWSSPGQRRAWVGWKPWPREELGVGRAEDITKRRVYEPLCEWGMEGGPVDGSRRSRKSSLYWTRTLIWCYGVFSVGVGERRTAMRKLFMDGEGKVENWKRVRKKSLYYLVEISWHKLFSFLSVIRLPSGKWFLLSFSIEA